MYTSSNQVVFWFGIAIVLLQRVCVIMMMAYISMRFQPVRRVLSGDSTSWHHQLATAIFFGFLAILGTHLGLIFDTKTLNWDLNTRLIWPLQPYEAIIGLRDLMVMLSGIFGGVWVGLVAGIIAAGERLLLQGDIGGMSACATVVLGVVSGLFRHFWAHWASSAKGALTICLLGTFLQKIILSLGPVITWVPKDNAATLLTWETTWPLILSNCLGCLFFMLVMKDLEHDKTKIREQNAQLHALHIQAELDAKIKDHDKIKIAEQNAQLRALHAQVEPHFLNNMLTAIQSLIHTHPDGAFDYVSKLANFLNKTRISARANAITLAEELSHLKLYVDFQELRFPNRFSFHVDIPSQLMGYFIAPRSLQTLIENVFIHARRGKKDEISIHISGEDKQDAMLLSVTDTGCGIPQERVALLGQMEVASEQGGGSALYQISQNLALAFNGKAHLKIESQLGVGTTIYLHIPKVAAAW